MPAHQLRCEAWVIPEGDRTGEKAIECGSIALAGADAAIPRCSSLADQCNTQHENQREYEGGISLISVRGDLLFCSAGVYSDFPLATL